MKPPPVFLAMVPMQDVPVLWVRVPFLGGAALVITSGQQALRNTASTWPRRPSERDKCCGPCCPGVRLLPAMAGGCALPVPACPLFITPETPQGTWPVFPTSRNFDDISEYTDLSEMHSLENTRNGLAPQEQIPTGASHVVCHSHPISGRPTPLAQGQSHWWVCSERSPLISASVTLLPWGPPHPAQFTLGLTVGM